MPNIDFWRPADGNETSAAYYSALTRRQTPSILSLSRQNLPNLEGSTIERALKGGYVVHEVQGEDLTIVSTGSEVSIALEAAVKLNSEGVKTRVVSLPCWSIFDLQPAEYKLSVLRSGAPILSVEALSVSLLRSCFCVWSVAHGSVIALNRLWAGRSTATRCVASRHPCHSGTVLTPLLQAFGLTGWGASGPYKKVYEKFGLTGPSTSSVFSPWLDQG